MKQDANAMRSLKSPVNSKYETEDATNQIAATSTGVSSDSQRFDFYTQRASVASSTAPTAPSTLTATPINNAQISLSWAASTDPVGVVGYYIFRNGVNIGTAYGAAYTDQGLSASTSYSYTVQAFDPAGNVSGQSGAAYVTTAGANLALASSGGIPSASSTYNNANWNVSYLNDGLEAPTNGMNGWSSGSADRSVNHTEWAQIDLGTSRTVGMVTLFSAGGIVFPIDFNIAVSTDGASWTQVITKTGYPFATGPQTFIFPNTTARYVRVTGTSLRPDPNDNGYYWMRLGEMEVYANPNLAPSAANWYYLSNVNSGLVMDDSSNSLTSGSPVIQWNLNNGSNQEWRFVFQPNGSYKLLNRLSGLYLDVSGGSAAAGQKLVQASSGSGVSQLWTLQQVSGTQFKLINLNSRLVADVSGASTTAGADVIQWKDSGHANQQWSLTQAAN
jgi:chitodextrinase